MPSQKTYTLNSKFHTKNLTDNEYIYDFGKLIQDAKKISIVSYSIANTAGTINTLNRKIKITDITESTSTHTLGEVGKWINLEELSLNIVLNNSDNIHISFDTDSQTMKFENTTNTNNFKIDMFENYSLASVFGFEPIIHQGAHVYMGSYYPSNQTSFINIACDNVRERDDAIQRKNDGVYSLFKVFTDTGYGAKLVNDFTVFPDTNLIRTLKLDSFRDMKFILYDEYGNRLQIKGHVLISFRLYFS